MRCAGGVGGFSMVELMATVSVVALPTPAAPPVTRRPLWQAIRPRMVPNTPALNRPVVKSRNSSWLMVLLLYSS